MHDKMKLLLPWYANGTLNEQEMVVVTGHLEQCGSCQLELDSLMNEMRALNEESPASLPGLLDSRDVNFAQLKALISAPKPNKRIHIYSYIAIAATLIFTITLTLSTFVDEPVTYRTLTTVPMAAEGPIVQVVFKSDTTERDIRLFLLETEAQLIGIPSPRGVYRMNFPNDSGRADIVEQLNVHPIVRWVHKELE